jgi:hypothetical protein
MAAEPTNNLTLQSQKIWVKRAFCTLDVLVWNQGGVGKDYAHQKSSRSRVIFVPLQQREQARARQAKIKDERWQDTPLHSQPPQKQRYKCDRVRRAAYVHGSQNATGRPRVRHFLKSKATPHTPKRCFLAFDRASSAHECHKSGLRL